jgi:hypothetical protein
MGDITRRGRYFGLPFHTWTAATAVGLELACPEIVRLSHGATSNFKRYNFSFIPRVHDICFVFRKVGGSIELGSLRALRGDKP